jgi:hypothetical protein
MIPLGTRQAIGRDRRIRAALAMLFRAGHVLQIGARVAPIAHISFFVEQFQEPTCAFGRIRESRVGSLRV